MCNRYLSPDAAAIERLWAVRPGTAWTAAAVYPRAPGPFIRRVAAERTARELVVGQWALIPVFADSRRLAYSTNNARFEEITTKASYKGPWARGQRSIIPAESFDEPCWETGRNVWWRFVRTDGEPWGLAGLYNTWLDRSTGELIESYTMLTVNADHHPLMKRMHKPDPAYGPEAQDKRSVVVIERDAVEAWLTGTPAEAAALVAPPAMAVVSGAPLKAAR